MTAVDDREYLPAMGRATLLPLYDPFTRLLGVRDAHWRLVAQAGIEPGATVLEIGCGTGNLLLLAAHAVPGATLIGLDPDPAVLSLAGRKARRAGVTLRLDRGYADRLPYPDGSVDRVLSAFMLHHLPHDQQQAALTPDQGHVDVEPVVAGDPDPVGYLMESTRGGAHLIEPSRLGTPGA